MLVRRSSLVRLEIQAKPNLLMHVRPGETRRHLEHHKPASELIFKM
eukprot:SAG31_NODE_49_length_30599_cov_15.615016_37_plen_46_part_00